MSDYIKVKPTKTDDKVCLFEMDAMHPNNEVFIKNDGQTYTVGLTSEVAKRIKDGALVQVGGTKSAIVETPAEVTESTVEETKPTKKAK